MHRVESKRKFEPKYSIILYLSSDASDRTFLCKILESTNGVIPKINRICAGATAFVVIGQGGYSCFLKFYARIRYFSENFEDVDNRQKCTTCIPWFLRPIIALKIFIQYFAHFFEISGEFLQNFYRSFS